jgi:transcription-repair coupling factor (superfamily II helicase)
MTDALARLGGSHWPYEIEGAQGGLLGFFLAEYVERIHGRILVVVPTEKELETLRADLDLSRPRRRGFALVGGR